LELAVTPTKNEVIQMASAPRLPSGPGDSD
jgi:hypothetical protein